MNQARNLPLDTVSSSVYSNPLLQPTSADGLLEGPTADFCEKGGRAMIPLRKEIKDYSSACEHLIYAAASTDSIPLTQDEIDWISYYAAEMTNLVDQVLRISKTQVLHDRQTIQDFAIASEALFLTDGFSEDEKDSIRQSVSNVTTQVLDEQKDPAFE